MNRIVVFLIVISVCAFALRVYRLDQPNRYYFDEVYHVVTARAYSHNNPAAYNPFSPAPEEGTAYDWLHPPFAKLIQAASIKLIGDNPMGWRLPSAFAGTGIIIATFLIAFALFGPVVAVFSSLVILFENLNLVMSRITMNDVFVTFFVLLGFLFATKYLTERTLKNILWSSLFLGLAYASKWTGLYAIGMIFLFLLVCDYFQKKLSLKIILLILLPPIIYLLSYGQFWLQGNSVKNFIDLHKQIWWYQNRHDLQHSYGTTPIYCVPTGLDGQKSLCPWILNVRGVYFSYEDYGAGKSGFVYALGNSFVFWFGIASISYLIGKYFEKKDKKLLFVLFGYFVFWVPWIFSPRILFLYHYLPAVPFMAISTGLMLSDLYRTRFKFITYFILLLFAISFVYFYPISTGFPIDVQDIEKYMWFRSWR